MLSFGRAATPGEALLFLRDGRIVVTGDLLIEPATYALSVYPMAWLDALERLDALDATVLVPDHGTPLYDEEHLRATMEAMRILWYLHRAREELDGPLPDAIAPIPHG